MATENTSFIGVFGGTSYDLYKQFINNNPGNDKHITSLAELYVKWGRAFTLRADLAWAQMEHETGFLRYKGIAKPEWNNFAGIGITGPGAKQTFRTPELGVIAHYAHLAWYLTPNHVNHYCSKTYDPRHFGNGHRFNGDSTIKRLGGTWAVPGKTYAATIAALANQIHPSVPQDTPLQNWPDKLEQAIGIKTLYRWSMIAIHHSVSDQNKTTMAQIAIWHKNRKPPFLREGYNFGINGLGQIEVGRPLDMPGAHTLNFNTKAIGICLYGDFRKDILTASQQESAYKLCAEFMSRYSIPVENVKGHKEFPGSYTACPVIDMNRFRLGLTAFLNTKK